MIVPRGAHEPVDLLLDAVGAESVLILPLFVRTRVMGSLQLFGSSRTSFSEEDAQLLWILSLVVENLLTRDFANEALIKFAFTDFLTGMKTRGYFETQLEREIKRAERSKGPLALVMIDIDHFKILNDTHGHHVGDVLLRDVSIGPDEGHAADRYRRALRRRGIRAHSSGDEQRGRVSSGAAPAKGG